MLFYDALEVVCKKHNLTKVIYEYIKNMNWYDSDAADSDILLEMVDKGIIEYGDKYESYEDNSYSSYKLVEKHKGYNSIIYGKWYGDKETLEKTCKINGQEVIWLDLDIQEQLELSIKKVKNICKKTSMAI